MNPFLDAPTPSVSFIFLLLNHQNLLAWTMCLNESSLLDEGQEAGPVFIPPESFTKLPRAYTHTQSESSCAHRRAKQG